MHLEILKERCHDNRCADAGHQSLQIFGFFAHVKSVAGVKSRPKLGVLFPLESDNLIKVKRVRSKRVGLITAS